MSATWATLLAGAALLLAIPGSGSLRLPALSRREHRRREREVGPGDPSPPVLAPRVATVPRASATTTPPVARPAPPPRLVALVPSIVAPTRSQRRAEVVDVLVGLGFRPGPAGAAADAARARYPTEPDLEPWLRDALRSLRPPAPRSV